MTMEAFVVAMKSTLDKVMTDQIAAMVAGGYPDLKGADLDDNTQFDKVKGAAIPALLWQFNSLDPVPRDPLYQFSFLVGAKTVADAGNYTLTALIAKLSTLFEEGVQHRVFDYSETPVSADMGYFLVSSMSMAPQQFDQQSNIRLWLVTASAQRM